MNLCVSNFQIRFPVYFVFTKLPNTFNCISIVFENYTFKPLGKTREDSFYFQDIVIKFYFKIS